MHAVLAERADFFSWLRLAAEVEHLFGPLVGDPGFYRALRRNIRRGTAFCVREDAASPAAMLLGGLLFSPKPPRYTIGWLAVSSGYRRRGIGQRLVAHALSTVQPPAEVVVTTFGPAIKDGIAARRFYGKLGFHAAEMAPGGPDGRARQVFRRAFV